jgi:hypothetical protein
VWAFFCFVEKCRPHQALKAGVSVHYGPQQLTHPLVCTSVAACNLLPLVWILIIPDRRGLWKGNVWQQTLSPPHKFLLLVISNDIRDIKWPLLTNPVTNVIQLRQPERDHILKLKNRSTWLCLHRGGSQHTPNSSRNQFMT